jgi:hypothetical protein
VDSFFFFLKCIVADLGVAVWGILAHHVECRAQSPLESISIIKPSLLNLQPSNKLLSSGPHSNVSPLCHRESKVRDQILLCIPPTLNMILSSRSHSTLSNLHHRERKITRPNRIHIYCPSKVDHTVAVLPSVPAKACQRDHSHWYKHIFDVLKSLIPPLTEA